MSRLPREFQRLFLSTDAGSEPAAVAADAAVRALVLEVARPAQWSALSAVWQGVQADLQLPAPAIAVNGVDGMQLWFSLQQPVATARGHEFLEGLRRRYLAELPSARIALMALPRKLPALQADTGNWSAFVAPDLAPIFDDAPWLDIPPSEEGQADLLQRLKCIQPAAFDAALQHLQPVAEAPGLVAEAAADAAPLPSPAAHHDARHFLLWVMNDTAAPLALRIEAAKALLPYR